LEQTLIESIRRFVILHLLLRITNFFSEQERCLMFAALTITLRTVLIGLLLLCATYAQAVNGVVGTTVRPPLAAAKVKGCQVAKPGDYTVEVGDLIELDYSYPVVPDSSPIKVDFKQTLLGNVVKSPLGFRTVTTPPLVGASTIAFYFEAKKAGTETVTLIVDGDEYTYRITVK
jgi:hypothetical protein